MSIITSNNLSNEDINTGVSREIIFKKMVFILAFLFVFCLETFILDIVFQITEKKQQNTSKQSFDEIIDDP